MEKTLKDIAGWSTILFPILMLTGFVMHPDLLSWELVRSAPQLAKKFHHSFAYHYGHLLVLMAVPLIIASLGYWLGFLQGKGKKFLFWGGMLGILGAVVLAVDKGALCLVLSAFDTLPEAQFQAFVPNLQVIIDRAGLLKMVWLLSLLPLGAILQAIGLRKEGTISAWQMWSLIIGLLLLNNPDLGVITSLAGILLCVGYIPLGLAMLKKIAKWLPIASG